MTDSLTRRDLLATGGKWLAAGAVVAGLSRTALAAELQSNVGEGVAARTDDAQEPGLPGKHYTPVIVPNGIALPFTIVGGVKIFHLIAEQVLKHEFAPGLVADCWGFNGHVNGPVIEAVEGDHIRI